ncbi:hypothetical protein T440DRAFT_143863 [Plenodomus tracheiphilus IPT5]|uniref:AHC1-like C2H2 zinc-finger domain-containing protein n=1 Tax=Plenodomus tracheiphilus IPT5 TaxID=1408161 RepID=A0A6A7B0G4_9PLEO|nr:hypothetical protein T440DRAFT_143863 [Plenodomus tracheiphilus IPT5]
MQSMFRLAWSTESPGDKIMEKATLHKSKQMPMIEIPNFMSKIKRKRTDSPEPASTQHAQLVKKWKSAQGEARPAVVQDAASVDVVVPDSAKLQELPKAASADVLGSQPKAQPSKKENASTVIAPKSQPPAAGPDTTSTSATTMDSGLTAVQQAIEAHINYEILLKHNELRLIEQELAKCQVSLEQLRRCTLVPYPGNDGLSEDISLGIGPSLQPSSGMNEPTFAAPWGVTDGPYTRHYAKWLIEDPKFTPTSERALAQQAHGYFGMGEGRSTRGSFADYGSASRGRTSRTSTGMLKLTPLGETPAPTPKIDPLLHKRSTDGLWVRLYCAKCQHSNFSNTQGFLNHCRIKHGDVYKSHDHAAIACGVPVDASEVGATVTASEPPSAATLVSTVTFPVPATPGIVNPLASQAVPAPRAKAVHRDPSVSSYNEPQPVDPVTCKGSSSTPYLMAQAQNCGFTGDLPTLVAMAKSKVDLDAIEHSDDDSADTGAAPTPVTAKPIQARFPPTNGLASKAPLARPGSQKGTGSQARLPVSFPPSALSHVGHHMPDSPVDLSPHTAESNPGLVSDHDDDDDEDVDDAHSQPDLILHDDDVVVEDASDVEGAHERAGSRPGLSCYEKGETSRKH